MNELFEVKRMEWNTHATEKSDPGSQVGRTDMSHFVEIVTSIRNVLEITDSDSILDVGCGNGHLLKMLAPSNSLSGIDYSENMIHQARNLLKGDFRIGCANLLPWPSECFDKVLCYSILHYMDSEQMGLMVIRECIRVCKQGGAILIGDILDKNHEARIKNGSNVEYERQLPFIHRYSHWIFYDLRELVAYAESLDCKAQIIRQPEHYRLSHYRSDLLIHRNR